MPFTTPPMACSRIPKWRLRPSTVGAEVPRALHASGSIGQVRGAADQLRHAPRRAPGSRPGRVPRGELGLPVEDRGCRVPAGRSSPPIRRWNSAASSGNGAIAVEAALPFGDALPRPRPLPELRERLVRNEERLVRSSRGLLGQRLRPGRAVSHAPSAVSCLFGLPKPMCVRTAMSRPIVRRAASIAIDRLEVVAVVDPLDVPAVGLERAATSSLNGQGRRAVELDPVVVVENDQLASRRWPARLRGFGRDAFHEVAVASDHVRPVIDDRVARPVEVGSEVASAIAMPTAFAKPWPSGPVVASTPGVRPYSGWPGVAIPTGGSARARRAAGRSPSGGGASRGASNVPAERTKRSRSGQCGSVGAWRIKRVQST